MGTTEKLEVLLFCIILSIIICIRVSAQESQQVLPLRQFDSIQVIISDLEDYIPDYMREQDIPGVGIALIHDGKIVWTEGFGVANTITQRPILPETIFEVASNSKVVTAYIALRLVDQGLLSLDKPLTTYLLEPWLPPSEYRNMITLRHVLSHSSGLAHNTTSRHSLFTPGHRYSYSAIGYQYVQAVIEEVTGRSLEDIAREIVFTPLGMTSSSFINRAEFISYTSNGHVHAMIPVLIFIVLYFISLIIIGLMAIVILRIRTGSWRPNNKLVIGVFSGAFVLALVPVFFFFTKTGLLEFAWLIAFCGLTLIIVFIAFFLAGRASIVYLFQNRLRLKMLLLGLWSILILVGLYFLSNHLTNVPVPKWPDVEARAAASMRAPVGDMAAFLIEISNPQHLNAEIAIQLQTSQIDLNSNLAWGLGPGIYHSQNGDALWQWGQHIDFQSIMIIYPEHQIGAVVCTNNDLLNPDVALEIAHRAIGGEIEPIRRAIHLEFNYREQD
jgi:CubicO group peptidase (beta-lactamase class C family)